VTAAAAPSPAALRALVDNYLVSYPEDVARELERMPSAEALEFFASRPAQRCSAVLERLSPGTAAAVLAGLDTERACELIAVTPLGQAAVLLTRMAEKTRETILERLDRHAAAELDEMMRYPADSAGALMDPAVLTFRRNTTVAEALERLRTSDASNKHAVFLIDTHGNLIGRVPVVELALAADDARLESVADMTPASIHAMAVRQDVIERFELTKQAVLPVVDFEGRLLGVIRHAALLDAARESVSSDIQAMVGVSRDETALSTVTFAVKKRLPWLEINLVTAFVAASVVGLFEATIAQFTALAVLLPVVAGQSGNTGAQALAVAMRGLALREIRPRHWKRLAIKEMTVAALNGVAVALTTGAGVYLWSRSFGLSLVICVSMVISMTAAGLAGAGIPLILTSLKQDPAQSSSIILTTVTDVVGFFSFLGIATILSSML